MFIIAGPEFGELEGHTLVVSKALYGLKSSALRWRERLSDVLREMGFKPTLAEADIWMRECGDHYEYISVYVDDLLIISRNPQPIVDDLRDKYKFKLKGTGPIDFYLGCNFFRDDEGNLCYQPRQYIEKMLDNYKRLFDGKEPKKAVSPLVKNDHPELDDSELLDLEGIKIYQSLIGALQWVIQIGRWDVATAVMSLSRFRAAPRIGHLERVKRVHGYLKRFKFGVIRIRTEEPDYSNMPSVKYDWTYSQYPDATDYTLPDNAPKPLGKPIVTSHFVDANLYHDLVTGRAVTGCLDMWNKTVVDHYSKLQNTVEVATFGSEAVAARIAAERIIDLRLTAAYLGVHVKESVLFGDNETVVKSITLPHARLHKRHNMLSYHKARECVAAGIFRMIHIRGECNPADILSKHWDMASVWETLKPLMFWHRNILDEEEAKESEKDVKAISVAPTT